MTAGDGEGLVEELIADGACAYVLDTRKVLLERSSQLEKVSDMLDIARLQLCLTIEFFVNWPNFVGLTATDIDSCDPLRDPPASGADLPALEGLMMGVGWFPT